MSKLKKAMSVPVVFSLVFAAAGCSSPSNNASLKATPASGSTTAPTAQSADASKSGEQSNTKKTKLIFWDKSEYVKEYNDSQKERVAQFSKEFNVDVEYVAIPPADLKTKLLAAVEAGNPPDLLLS